MKGAAEAERVLYLMQGVPGSGKSRIADMIAASYTECPIISTDDYRMQPQPMCLEHGHTGGELVCPKCGTPDKVTVEDIYVFDAEDNARYHQMAQQAAARLMADGYQAIVIDNTNIQEWAARPYIVLANIYGYTVEVVSVDCGLHLSMKRQVERREDRRVPDEVIKDMYSKMERLLT